METLINPLEAVQLIPIFNCINILSDFLYIEHYLQEIDQNKQIPIVNALYQYLQDYQNNKLKKDELIRNLLNENDLYGAKEDEEFDVTFVNVMFEYIISSLVFDKYGNIYGFLGEIFCEAENLQFPEVLNIIKLHLQNASFDNEYGSSSTLSDLSMARIYNDIILPLFPVPKDDISLLSLDYIYAQAGSMFLRAGRINSNNYINLGSNSASLTNDNLFNEYLIIGHVIESFLLTDNKNFNISKAFALPALTYYIFNYKYLFTYENMANLISDSIFWQAAYEHLFKYTTNAFNEIEIKLKNDYTLQMHMALSSFQNSATLAKKNLKKYCPHLDAEEMNFRLPLYINYPKSFECIIGEKLPNLQEYAENKINNILELYEKYNLQLVQEAFSKSLIHQIENSKVIIKLLLLNNTVENNDFDKSELISFDILEFFFPNNISFNYYILKYEDYSAMLINYIDNDHFFTKDIRLQIEKLFNMAIPKILKRVDENITEFFDNYVWDKKSRLEGYLVMLSNNQGKYKHIKNDWWKNFGLSLVPHYHCLSDKFEMNYKDICAPNNISLFYKYPLDIYSKTIDIHSRTFLSSLGTNIISIFLKKAGNEAVDSIVIEEQKYRYSMKNVVNRDKIFQDISLHLKDPAFQLTFATKDMIRKLEQIINSLRNNIDFSFTLVISSFSKILTLKSHFYKSIGSIGEQNSRLIFINTINNKSEMGYGYKFIFLSDNKCAKLRTDYEFKNKILIKQIIKFEMEIYTVLNNVTFKPNYIVYKNDNNQFWRKSTNVLFTGISIQDDDCNENCMDIRYLENLENINICQRRRRLLNKYNYEEEAINFIKKNTKFSEEQIRNMLRKYTFPDNATLTLFVRDWLKTKSFHEPIWSKEYIINDFDLLEKLRYDLRFEEHNTISEYEAEFRINSLYSKADRRQIENEVSLESIVKQYNEQKASFAVTFHDYYAIRNYATTGYQRITKGTHEAKLMKMALYKLAIRQSDDPVDEFDLTLFIVESKSVAFLRTTPPKNYITLQKFTKASPSMNSAIRFSVNPAVGYINIVYEIIFSGPYLRVKIEQFYNHKEENVILLPGSKFRIEYHEFEEIEGLGKVLKIKLKFLHFYDKCEWYKNIMNIISQINF
ncbi:uncharacterized protein LOC127280836 [Leptopilina boulardi]|uniref:uncharacterized protein LOC127280836 n=1 Tax=Leptopilina boulardi TaxID=63433 RepID=UPI0021F68696|nr:uncharacterized protein LOC127280836 [Leptopilina boulardi]